MALWSFFTLICIILSGVEGRVITLENKCKDTIWPGILIEEGSTYPQELEGDLVLRPGQAFNVTVPQHWTISVWGGNGCSYNSVGYGTCVTGGCDRQRCTGERIPSSPVTLVVLYLDSQRDVYGVDVSGGFNIPISVSPYGKGSAECKAASCPTDVNRICPGVLQMKSNYHVVACRSDDCLLRDRPERCCSNSSTAITSNSDSSHSGTCMWTDYLMALRTACPTATLNGFDWTNMFECHGPNYLISFC
ncbi:Protein NP24 precursor, putative [Ricinus communis]|uniref:Protein NP24, putative n=1 Tax=Ricinus communis TaxID=3988 RepID=B9SLL4_RICCO|nr:Protein NP24 precursor, putative [Ricinus communis]|eukprot:XP_002526883.1 pathogenesis-related protein 5 [Ricinus communis]